MTLFFLGPYLLRRGVITQAQLDQAIALQVETNQRLGDLAVEAGLLTPGQVLAVLGAQRHTDRNFGELAISMGYVPKPAMHNLIFRQQVRQTHLGEALLATGALTPEQFSVYLYEYSLEERQRGEVLTAVLGAQNDNPVIYLLVGALERAFPRFLGNPLKAQGELTDADLERLTFAYGSHILMRDGCCLRYKLHLGAAMLDLFNDVFAIEPLTEVEAEKGVEELLSAVCTLLRSAVLEGPGCSSVCSCLPLANAERLFRLRFASPEADIGLTAFFEAPATKG